MAVESREVRTTTIGRLAAPVLVTEMTAVPSSSINATVVGLRDTSTASRGASVEEVWEGGRGGEGGGGEGRGEGRGKGRGEGERRGRKGRRGEGKGMEGKRKGKGEKGEGGRGGSEKMKGRMEQRHYLAKYISLHHFTVKMATVLLTIDVFYEDGSSVLAKGNSNWRLAELQSYEE